MDKNKISKIDRLTSIDVPLLSYSIYSNFLMKNKTSAGLQISWSTYNHWGITDY